MARMVNDGLSLEQTRNLQKVARLVYGSKVRYIAVRTQQESTARLDEDGKAVKGENGYTIYDTVGYSLAGFLGYDGSGKPLHYDCDADGFAPLAEIANDHEALEKAGFDSWYYRQGLQPWLRDEPISFGQFSNLQLSLTKWIGNHFRDLLPLEEDRDALYNV